MAYVFAYVIFETMNDRGLSLTQIEMLRSYLLSNIRPDYVPLIILSSDVFSKCISSHIVWFLPYARPQQESKNRTVYTHPTALEEALTMAQQECAYCVFFSISDSFLHVLGIFYAMVLYAIRSGRCYGVLPLRQYGN